MPSFRIANLVTLSSTQIYGEPSAESLGQLRDKIRLRGSGEVTVHPSHTAFSRRAS